MAKEKLKGNLMDRIRQASTVKLTALMDESKIFKERVMVPFKDFPLLNIASGGSLKEGGFGAGVTQLAGPSKHFKSNLALIHVKAYMDHFKDAICLFYDTEFGSTPSYFRNLGIDMSRVVHTPILNLEELKFDIMAQLDNIERGDHVIIMIDSIGNVASKKEVEDALEGKSTADMTRAKQLKSVFRMITPHLAIKDIPLIAINHIYMEQGMYPKAIVGGGTGAYYAADNIFIIGRQQDKDGTELNGFTFVLNTEKSRFVREKSKFFLNVSFETGINRYSGLFEIAEAAQLIVKPKVGWFAKVDSNGVVEDKLWRRGDMDTPAFWDSILNDPRFEKYIHDNYRLANPVEPGVDIGEED